MQLKISICRSTLWLLCRVIITANISLLLGSYIYNNPAFHLNAFSKIIFSQSDLGSENVIAAWYSSVLLFCSTVMAIICFLSDTKQYTAGKSRLLNFGWLVLAGCFAILSFDELGSIHEHIGDSAGFAGAGDAIITGVEEPGWKLFYLIVGLVGLFMLLFSIVRLRHVKWSLAFLIIGVCLYLSNPFQEYFEIQAMRSSANPSLWKRPVYFLLLEEGSELFGSFSFLMATVLYGTKLNKRIVIEHVFERTHINVVISCLLVALFLGTVFVHALFFDVLGDMETGVPKNWPPAIIAFIVSLICVYQYSNNKLLTLRLAFLVFAVFSMCMSVYYGCNRFNYIFTNAHHRSSVLMRVLILIASLIAFSFLKQVIAFWSARIMAVIAMFFIIGSAFVPKTYSSEMGVIAFAGVLLLIVMWNKGTPRDVVKDRTMTLR